MRSTVLTALHGLAGVVLAAGILFGCSNEEQSTSDDVADVETTTAVAVDGVLPTFHPSDNPSTLSGWGQVVSLDGALKVSRGVTPYTLNSALFSDYALKLRTVWLPAGAAASGYEPEEVFDFPIGTVITKTFYYPLAEGDAADDRRVLKAEAPSNLAAPIDLTAFRLIETRVLAHRESGWATLPYVWNDDQTEATLERAGDLVSLTLVEGADETPFPYVVPNANQCAGCHATNHTTKEVVPIGPKARHLNTSIDLGDGPTPQLDVWEALGLVSALPVSGVPAAVVWDDDAATLDGRARAYLDINCAHCHNRNGPADTSGLFLEPSTEIGARLGICKGPVAAGTGTGGRLVGIHPGQPDESIFVFRMETTDPGAMMPELGRSLAHREGVELISEWIESLDGAC